MKLRALSMGIIAERLQMLSHARGASLIDSNVNVTGWKNNDITRPFNAFK